MIFFCLQCCINTQFEFNRCWKHQRSSEFMVHIDTIAAADDLLGAHQWCKSLIPPHLKCALLAWNVVTMKVIWVQWTHYHVEKQSEMIWALWHRVLSWWKQPSDNDSTHKGVDVFSNNTQVRCVFKEWSVGNKNVSKQCSPHPYITISSMEQWLI